MPSFQLLPGRLGAACAGLLLAFTLTTAPAWAATEDTDTNDNNTPNNVVDDGDNAHPSGKDRSVENGKSENQGKAVADPDNDGRGPDRENGGVDQPDGPGGDDLADQDANNGCGNDDDFEDDNEGWCTRPPADTDTEPEVDAEEKETTTPRTPAVLSSGEEAAPATNTAVLGVQFERPAEVPAPAQVLGVTETLGAALARTGPSLLAPLTLAGAALVALGLFLRRSARLSLHQM